jgi:hypothetical protein
MNHSFFISWQFASYPFRMPSHLVASVAQIRKWVACMTIIPGAQPPRHGCYSAKRGRSNYTHTAVNTLSSLSTVTDIHQFLASFPPPSPEIHVCNVITSAACCTPAILYPLPRTSIRCRLCTHSIVSFPFTISGNSNKERKDGNIHTRHSFQSQYQRKAILTMLQ